MLEYKTQQLFCILACEIFTQICEYLNKTAYIN